jgi:ABC-type Fe3+-hydroxamate transport system substrate-binding protein
VGGTKNPRVEAILDLTPDLVIANQEENSRGDLERLAANGVRVYVCFPKKVAEGLAHMAKVARMLGVEGDAAVKLLIKTGYEALREAEATRTKRKPLRAFCPIWMDPLMTVNGATFISDMMDLGGAQNVFADRERRYPLAADLGRAVALPPERVANRDVRYPRVTLEEVTARAPELILLPDEPHPFSESDADVFRGLRNSALRVVLRTDGKDLCWYGARSIEGIGRIRSLLANALP